MAVAQFLAEEVHGNTTGEDFVDAREKRVGWECTVAHRMFHLSPAPLFVFGVSFV